MLKWFTISSILICYFNSFNIVTAKTVSSSVATKSRWFKPTALTIGFGTYSEFYHELQIDGNGSDNGVEFNPTIFLGIAAKTKLNLIVKPELILVLPQERGFGDLYKTTFILRSDIGKVIFKNFYLMVGSSLIVTNYYGSGGETMLNNASSTSPFYIPDQPSTSYNNTFDYGFEYQIKNYSFKFQVLNFQIFNSERKMSSYLVSLNYYWDGIQKKRWFK
ncbi:MAG: hypothetical protein ACI9QD_000668 [Thermoproteota archaeon]|jgi:hypothetical protein